MRVCSDLIRSFLCICVVHLISAHSRTDAFQVPAGATCSPQSGYALSFNQCINISSFRFTFIICDLCVCLHNFESVDIGLTRTSPGGPQSVGSTGTWRVTLWTSTVPTQAAMIRDSTASPRTGSDRRTQRLIPEAALQRWTIRLSLARKGTPCKVAVDRSLFTVGYSRDLL